MAQYEEFSIDQGADVAVELHLVDENGVKKNLTNFTVNAQMRKSYNTIDDEAITFNSIIATPPSDGVVTLSLTNTQTEALKRGRYVYDVELSFEDSDGNTIVERILEGRVQVTPSVTRVALGGEE